MLSDQFVGDDEVAVARILGTRPFSTLFNMFKSMIEMF